MTERKDSYKKIVQSTFLFGFVQVFNIISKVGVTKVVAVLLGTEGMGIIGLFQSIINVLSTVCGLGLSQSAVKDISQGANESFEQFSKSISLAKKLVLLLALFGMLVTIVLSPWLSEWTFGDGKYTYAFMGLSVVIFLNIITEGQLAILKGARMLRFLAKASLLGSVVGLITSIPLYFWLGEKGIVPSLIVAALTAMVLSWYFVRKIKYNNHVYAIKQAVREGKVMIQMGIALMYVTFLASVSDYIIRTFISHVADVNVVGLFQAGSMIIIAYFGIVITALTTDYYPRISAINKNNEELQQEFNRQSEVGLLMVGSLVIIILVAMPLFVKILYTEAFMPIISFLQYAVFGVLFTVCSNALGMILLAKQASRIFFYTATIGRIVILGISLLCFKYWGLEGLGVAGIITGIFHLSLMSIVIWNKYRIKMNKELYTMLFIVIMISLCAFFIKNIDDLFLRYLLGILLLGIYIAYALFETKRLMDINVIEYIKKIIMK